MENLKLHLLSMIKFVLDLKITELKLNKIYFQEIGTSIFVHAV